MKFILEYLKEHLPNFESIKLSSLNLLEGYPYFESIPHTQHFLKRFVPVNYKNH
jgi:hypothetical protein